MCHVAQHRLHKCYGCAPDASVDSVNHVVAGLCGSMRCSSQISTASRPAPFTSHTPHRARWNGKRGLGSQVSVSVASPLVQPQLSHNTVRLTDQDIWVPRRQSSSEDVLPIFVSLEHDVLNSAGDLAYVEALRVGLKALKLLGISGVQLDIHWGLVERSPRVYSWSGYRQLMRLILDLGFKLKISLCFNSCDSVPLPAWVREAGRQNPDIWYTDRQGFRSQESLTLGIDHVPVLGGRTAVTVYQDLMHSFKQEFGAWLGANNITELLIGLGPNAQLKYPAHPIDGSGRWEYPGTGEVQCYDKYMLSIIKACAEQVKQPSWGLGGPHDACKYKEWPHQSGFFSANGSWSSPYGKFFMQLYSELLICHASDVMGAATQVFKGTPVLLNARIPGCMWWYNTPSHAAELTAGYYNTSQRDGYLPVFKALQALGVGLHLGLAEARAADRPASHNSDPERLLLTQRTVAAALHMPVTLENTDVRFDEGALTRMEASLLEPTVHQGVELPQPRALVVHRMSDAIFEPFSWQRFKQFVSRVRDKAEQSAAVPPYQPSMDEDILSASLLRMRRAAAGAGSGRLAHIK